MHSATYGNEDLNKFVNNMTEKVQEYIPFIKNFSSSSDTTVNSSVNFNKILNNLQNIFSKLRLIYTISKTGYTIIKSINQRLAGTYIGHLEHANRKAAALIIATAKKQHKFKTRTKKLINSLEYNINRNVITTTSPYYRNVVKSTNDEFVKKAILTNKANLDIIYKQVESKMEQDMNKEAANIARILGEEVLKNVVPFIKSTTSSYIQGQVIGAVIYGIKQFTH
jgi:hypothetical protein